MRKLKPYLEDIVYLIELSLIVMTGKLLRVVVVGSLPSVIKVKNTVIDSRWVALPILFVLLVIIAWLLHRRLHAWLLTKDWWIRKEDE
ncbi:MAG: hypothetical protein WAZ19_09450 [Anaerolineae bacterium]